MAKRPRRRIIVLESDDDDEEEEEKEVGGSPARHLRTLPVAASSVQVGVCVFATPPHQKSLLAFGFRSRQFLI